MTSAIPPLSRATTWPSLEAALETLSSNLGDLEGVWRYRDAESKVVGAVVRCGTENGGLCHSLRLGANGWEIGAMPTPRPLFRLPELQESKGSSQPVLFVEDEQSAEVAAELGFVATTIAGGSRAANESNLNPLRGRRIWILRGSKADSREAGLASVKLEKAGASEVRIVRLQGTDADVNLADLVATAKSQGDSTEDIRRAIEGLASQTRPSVLASTEPVQEVRTKKSTGEWQGPQLICLQDVEDREVQWLWTNRIPLGSITLLVGNPGCGKSYLTTDLAARVTRGMGWPLNEGQAPQGDVLFVANEDEPSVIRRRLDCAGADLRRVQLLQGRKMLIGGKQSISPFNLQDLALLQDTLDIYPKAKLVIIDPLGDVLGDKVDAHRDNEIRAVLNPLQTLAREKNVAVALVCHTRKAAVTHADDATLGSRGIVGVSRSVLHLTVDPEDEARERKFLLPGKSNLGKRAAGLAFRIGNRGCLEWETAPVQEHADDVFAARQQGKRRGPEPKKRDEAAEWLLDLLRTGPRLVTEVHQSAKEAGLAKATIERARKSLGIIPKKSGFNGPWTWGLPPDLRSNEEDHEGGEEAEQPGCLRESSIKMDRCDEGTQSGETCHSSPAIAGNSPSFESEEFRQNRN